MQLKDLIRKAQKAIGVTADGEWGQVSASKADFYEISVSANQKVTTVSPSGKSLNPAFNEAKKYEGKGESDKGFVAFMSSYWRRAGLPGYKTIVGSLFAWCGLFVFMANTNVGQKSFSGIAGAKNWARYGVEVEYKKNGAPRGAVVHINHKHNCNSKDDNHVAFLNGNCTAEDLTKSGGTINLYGGNQSNKVKVTAYSNKEICEIRWPEEIVLPGKITVSDGCSGSATQNESTR